MQSRSIPRSSITMPDSRQLAADSKQQAAADSQQAAGSSHLAASRHQQAAPSMTASNLTTLLAQDSASGRHRCASSWLVAIW